MSILIDSISVAKTLSVWLFGSNCALQLWRFVIIILLVWIKIWHIIHAHSIEWDSFQWDHFYSIHTTDRYMGCSHSCRLSPVACTYAWQERSCLFNCFHYSNLLVRDGHNLWPTKLCRSVIFAQPQVRSGRCGHFWLWTFLFYDHWSASVEYFAFRGQNCLYPA